MFIQLSICLANCGKGNVRAFLFPDQLTYSQHIVRTICLAKGKIDLFIISFSSGYIIASFTVSDNTNDTCFDCSYIGMASPV